MMKFIGVNMPQEVDRFEQHHTIAETVISKKLWKEYFRTLPKGLTLRERIEMLNKAWQSTKEDA
jgi:hypothetical protein